MRERRVAPPETDAEKTIQMPAVRKARVHLDGPEWKPRSPIAPLPKMFRK